MLSSNSGYFEARKGATRVTQVAHLNLSCSTLLLISSHLELSREQEERRKEKHQKMEEEREKIRKGIRDKVGLTFARQIK